MFPERSKTHTRRVRKILLRRGHSQTKFTKQKGKGPKRILSLYHGVNIRLKSDMNKQEKIQKHCGGIYITFCSKREGNRQRTEELEREHILAKICPRTRQYPQAIVTDFQIKMSIPPKLIEKFNATTTKITKNFITMSVKLIGRNMYALITRNDNPGLG